MKKFLIVLGMVTCLVGTTACGSEKAADSAEAMQVNEAGAIAYADQVIDAVDQIVAGGMQANYESDAVISAALTSWEAALTDLGTYQGITDHVVTADADGIRIEAAIDGSDHDATVVIQLDKNGNLTGITTNVIKSFGELMKNAGLNTLLGMGVVFVVLILISLLISCFKYIPVIQAKFSKKKTAPAPAPAAVAAPAPAAVEEVEAEEDDCELIAVIAAAIAASEGSTSTDGFVVRSIRRRSGKWQKA